VELLVSNWILFGVFHSFIHLRVQELKIVQLKTSSYGLDVKLEWDFWSLNFLGFLSVIDTKEVIRLLLLGLLKSFPLSFLVLIVGFESL
jgi:hypothetical protein